MLFVFFLLAETCTFNHLHVVFCLVSYLVAAVYELIIIRIDAIYMNPQFKYYCGFIFVAAKYSLIAIRNMSK